MLLLLLRNHSDAFRHRKCLIPLVPHCDYSWHGNTPGPQRSWAESSLPPSIRMILASTGPDISLDPQATLADKTMEVSPSLNNINTEQTRQQTADNSANISTVVARPGTQQADRQDLKMQMALLAEKADMLMCNPTGCYREPRTRQRERSPTPRRSSQSGNITQ